MRTIIILIVITLLSCNDHRSKPEVADLESVYETASYSEPEEKEAAPSTTVIKSANYRFQVENVDSTTKKIQSTVKRFQATIADMDLITVSNEISNNLNIRVPAQNFEQLIEALGTDAIFTNFKKISTDDVSEEFIDIESRLRTKKEVRDRYIDILKSKAKTVTDVLKAEEQIRIIQEEIEAREGRLKYLQNRVAFSTIHLEIYQHVEYQETPNVYQKPYAAEITQGFRNGWNILTTTFLLVVNIWPLVLLGIVIFWRRAWIKQKVLGKV